MPKIKISDHLIEAEKNIASAQNILNVIFPISLDQKILLKSLEKLHESLIHIMSFVLKVEHLKKNIVISKDRKENEKIFFEKCIARYVINENEQNDLHKVLTYAASHKASAVEFSRQEYIVLMNDELETVELYKEDLSRYISSTRVLLNKVLNKNLKLNEPLIES